jgi:hypothetical protein
MLSSTVAFGQNRTLLLIVFPKLMTRYFRVQADVNAHERWFLRSPINTHGEELDPRAFTRSSICPAHGPLTLPLRRDGRPVDFNFGDFDMPVVKTDIVDKLEDVLDLQLQRVPVHMPESAGKFEILNVLDQVDCIDAVKSVYTRWEANDGRPEKLGEYRMITDLKIDPKCTHGHHLFRVKGWAVALIVSEQMKQALESFRVSGIEYDLVC